MINAPELVKKLKSDDKTTKTAAIEVARKLSVTDRNELLRHINPNTLFKIISGRSKPVIDTSKVKIPAILKKQRQKTQKRENKVAQQTYGIYTVSDANFFPGVVANINSLRYHGCAATVAVIDIGLDLWMKNYLKEYSNVKLLDLTELMEQIRFTDIVSTDSPIMTGWAYKAFGIVHFDLFDCFTFIDADYLPLCDLEKELKPAAVEGQFLSTYDGENTWEKKHEDAIGVKPGKYVNINAGFITLSMKKYAYIIHEWRNLMTRKKPFGLWYGDQGALNAILDKYGIDKATVDRRIWNQTMLNTAMTRSGVVEKRGDMIFHKEVRQKIMGWHGTSWHKLWHQMGIDYYRKDKAEREKFYKDGHGKSPQAVVDIFREFLFMDKYNRKLKQQGYLIRVK